MSEAPGQRELDDLLHRAQASVRRQEADVADVLAGVERARDLTERMAVEIERERAESLRERREEEEQARTGALGRERRELQERLDRGETTWAEVLRGADPDPAAAAYRAELGGRAQDVVDRLREDDPEWGAAFDRFGPENPVSFPEPPTQMPDPTPPAGPGGPRAGGPAVGGPPGGGGIW